MSMLIAYNAITPDILICPSEKNTQFQKYMKYEYNSPQYSEGADHSTALWDPAFTACPADELRFNQQAGDRAGCSYAHLPPYGRQLNRKWKTYANSRGPSDAML